MHGEHVAGAARRRRERRLRQFLRHERLSVAMALAECTHHAVPRGQKMARAGGVEREENYEPRLLDPPLAQTAATVGYVAAAGPLLVVPSLAGGDSVDGTALRFLLKQTLPLKIRRTRRRGERWQLSSLRRSSRRRSRVHHGLPLTEANWAAWPGKMRKRKKRRKRRLPRGVRIWRCGQGFRSRSSLSAVQCSGWLVVDRPEMLGIVASMYQKDLYALVVPGSGMCKAGISGARFAVRSLRFFAGSWCSALWPVWTRRASSCSSTSLSWRRGRSPWS